MRERYRRAIDYATRYDVDAVAYMRARRGK